MIYATFVLESCKSWIRHKVIQRFSQNADVALAISSMIQPLKDECK